MDMTERSTLVGVFADRRQAERAVDELRHAGFRESHIGVAVRDAEVAEGTAAPCDTNTKVEEGAAAGALAGGSLGALAGVAAVGLIPGVGPVLAGGLLAGIAGGAAVGAVGGGLLGALVGMGIPEEEARFYECEFATGRALVTVQADGRSTEAVAILRRHGAYDASNPGYAPAGPTTGLP